MAHSTIWLLGCWLMACAAGLYIVTWILLVRYPNWLLGNVTMLWLRSLLCIVFGGLALTILWALDQIARTVLFWRH